MALENRSCRKGEKKIFSHCGGREIKGSLEGRGQCLVLRKVGIFSKRESSKGDEFERSLLEVDGILQG